MSSNSFSIYEFLEQNQAEFAVQQKVKTRRKIVKYIFIIYWLLIFEGALRKWAFPEYSQIIFFFRDPIALLIYIIAWHNNIFTRNGLLTAGLVMALGSIPLIFIQAVYLNMNPLTLIYGWRMYFFYLPLAFVIKDTIHHEDIYKLIRQTLYVGIPLSVLVYVQFISPRDSLINDPFGTGKAFVVTGTIVRTTGTFTFTAGQSLFAGSLIAMIIPCWLYRDRHPLLSLPWLIICTCTSIATLLLSGSRTAFFMAGLIVAATFFGLVFIKDTKLKFTSTSILIFLLLLGILMFLGPFQDSFNAIDNRFSEAEASEGNVIGRALAPLIAFTTHITNTPAIGYGIGYSTTGGSLLATGKSTITLAEDEWSRVILEIGPALGLGFIFYRIFFSFYLLRICIKSARFDNNLIPMIFLGFIGFHFFVGQITHTGTIQGYNWIFLGLIMAAAKNQELQKTTQQKLENLC